MSDKVFRKTIADMHALAEKMGGRCLSECYLGGTTHLVWQCNTCGLVWTAWPTKIQQGHWCPVCSKKAGGLKNRKYSIEDAQKIAEDRGGECLSESICLSTDKLLWRCGVCGHEWDANFHSVRRGCWCPKCGDLRSANSKRVRSGSWSPPILPRAASTSSRSTRIRVSSCLVAG